VFLAERLGTSRSFSQKLLAEGRVRCDGQPVKSSHKVERDSLVVVSVPPPQTLDLTPVSMALDVVYEDEDLVVLNKPRGLVVHPGAGTVAPTLVHGLLARYQDSLSAIGGVERPGIVHRLDKDTSGLLLVARSDLAHRRLSNSFATAQVKKTYVALVVGRMEATVEVDRPIGRDVHQRQKMCVTSTGRAARTRIEPIAVTPLGSVVLAYPRTGRTHQIRVHLRSLGHPVVGDATYGTASDLLDGQFLHAFRIAVEHPTNGRPMAFEAPLPQALTAILESTADDATRARLRTEGILT
jgi:23S rRNA pseudouridine1911/1915/1917 synthase